MVANIDTPGLLRLTPETRHHIYLHVGLGHANHESETAPAVYNLGNTYRGFPFHGLLLSCRTIYTKASALLYSANWFIIRYTVPPRSLGRVRDLTPSTVASLSHLKVELNVASCHMQGYRFEGAGGCCQTKWTYDQGQLTTGGAHTLALACRFNHSHNFDLPLDGSGPLGSRILEEWQATTSYLAAHIAPGRLELSLVCDLHPRDIEFPKRVLDSLSLLPRLKDCHVRLSRRRDPRPQHLAREAALRARGIMQPTSLGSSSSVGPRFMSLPREVRLHVLEYTDLITPFKEVMWGRASNGFYFARGRCENTNENGRCKAESRHHGCQFSECSESPWPQGSIGCFCSRTHAAFSSRCRCWAPPTPLFLVCRTLHSDANFVFYTQNRFIVVDSPSRSPYTPWGETDYPHQTFSVGHFLRHVVPRYCLGHIRFLELAFSPFNAISRPPADHPALRDWDQTLDWAKDKLNLPALTLRLIVAGSQEIRHEGSEGMTKADRREVLATYNRILAPLQSFNAASDGGLARFYTHLPWPLQWTWWVQGKLEVSEMAWGWLKGKDDELKRRAEQNVMEERYERASAAGPEPPSSVWTWAHLCNE